MAQRKKLVVIAGPTASGKTSLAIEVARSLHAEIVSADARQVFREMRIGTARPTDSELAEVPHHLVGHLSVDTDYSAGRYAVEAMEVLMRLFAKFDWAVLVGGSGLYHRALLEGFDDIPEVPESTRLAVVTEYESKGLTWLQEEVLRVDPVFASKADMKNPRRLMRALEVFRASGNPLTQYQRKRTRELPFEVIKVGIDPGREVLYRRIDQRVDQMVTDGLFGEVEQLYDKRLRPALQTVGYTEIFDMMHGAYDREEAIRRIKQNTRHYAKRQMTWFGRDAGIRWFEPSQRREILSYIQSI